MDQIDVEDNSHNPLRSTNAGDAEDQPNDSQKPTRGRYRRAFAILLLLLLFPIIIASTIYTLCFSKGNMKRKISAVKDDNKGIYAKLSSLELEPVKDKLRRLSTAAAAKLGYVALLWLLLNLCVPSFKRTTLFGSPLWKWSLLAVVILLGHLCCRILTRVIVRPTISFLNTSGREEIQLFIVGLQSSFSTFVYFGLVLTVWRVYFHGDDGLNPSPSVDKYGTWTLASLLVWAALRVLKRAALLNWEANAIYKRFKDRILIAGFHSFFLSIIAEDVERNDLKLTDGMSLKQLVDENKKSKHVTLVHVREVALRLANLEKVTSREDDATAKISRKCEEKIPKDDRCWEDIKQGSYDSFASMFKKKSKDLDQKKKRESNDDDIRNAKLLIEEMKAKYPNVDDITSEIVRKWMVDAHKNCLLVGYTLTDAFEVVSVLDAVLTCFIVIVVILFLLLATGLAETSVLITIGSIFIALSFMFGDTCKAFFQGVIFSFVTHPFDVGDLCIIDGVEVEVKRIGILTTTCIKIKTGEKMLYPSTDLSNKLIINLESKPDPMDLIEIVLDPLTKSDQIESVRKSIEEFIDGNTHGCYEKSHRVTMKEMGNSIMMSVRFKHILNAEGMTHSECFAIKDRQRYQLFIKMKKFLEDQHIESKG